MAEFVKIVNGARRMCESYEHCSDCPMVVTVNGCSLVSAGDSNEAEELEEIIMKWLEGKK